jgi:acyl carrier protein
VSRPTARELLAEVTGAEVAERVGPADDLVLAGVDSGDLIRLALLIEERLDGALDPERLQDLRTLAAIDAVLQEEAPDLAVRGHRGTEEPSGRQNPEEAE